MLRVAIGVDRRMVPAMWHHVLACWVPDEVYLWGDVHAEWERRIRGARIVQSLRGIGGEMVVFSPPDAQVGGEVPLEQFDHPDDALYVFGADHRTMYQRDLAARSCCTVYIPTTGHPQLHAHVAAGIVLHHRHEVLKRLTGKPSAGLIAW